MFKSKYYLLIIDYLLIKFVDFYDILTQRQRIPYLQNYILQ